MIPRLSVIGKQSALTFELPRRVVDALEMSRARRYQEQVERGGTLFPITSRLIITDIAGERLYGAWSLVATGGCGVILLLCHRGRTGETIPRGVSGSECGENSSG